MGRWGIWAPSYVNGLRSWSDQRGLNAMQMLCFLNVAYTATGNQTFMNAIDTLSNSTNQYNVNQVNLKIEAPCDDNFRCGRTVHRSGRRLPAWSSSTCAVCLSRALT